MRLTSRVTRWERSTAYDVSKNTLDTSFLVGAKPRSKSFANSPAGWRNLIAWLAEHEIRQSTLVWRQRGVTAWASRLHSMRQDTS